ncbi:MAG: YkgJ family cysteine cluster protein [Candidatus Verstraetearchaeota archaeon]|nr:YkgJ family cysteine cluster protein [Candidatus Verstraetearchaeota archaeon]
MADLKFVTPSTRFKCRRCARCCSLDVMLSDIEIGRLGILADKRWRTTRKVFRNGRMVCSLLDGNTCTIYKERPILCRVFPFIAIPESDFIEVGIEVDPLAVRVAGADNTIYVIIYDTECPGVGDGVAPEPDEILDLTLRHLREMSCINGSTR